MPVTPLAKPKTDKRNMVLCANTVDCYDVIIHNSLVYEDPPEKYHPSLSGSINPFGSRWHADQFGGENKKFPVLIVMQYMQKMSKMCSLVT